MITRPLLTPYHARSHGLEQLLTMDEKKLAAASGLQHAHITHNVFVARTAALRTARGWDEVRRDEIKAGDRQRLRVCGVWSARAAVTDLPLPFLTMFQPRADY